MIERAWTWRAWNASRERLCDSGWVRAVDELDARAAARQSAGGPHLEIIDEIEVQEIPFAISTSSNRRAIDGARREAMTFRSLRERVALLATAEEDVDPPDPNDPGERDLDDMPVLVRVHNDDGDGMIGALCDLDVELGCADEEAVVLDAQGGP